MRVDVRGRVPADQIEVVWRLYNDAFDELRTTAVQRHVMIRDEFDDVMDDHRVAKYLGVDTDRGGRLCALATLTNDLDAIALISPDYFQRRWPVHFTENRIWYIGFVAIHPEYRSSGLFEMVVHELYRVVSASQGIATMDFCRRNEEMYRLPHAIHRLLEGWAGLVRSDRMDEQSYWFYEFPTDP